jgi:HK97 family phage prohead protease
VLRFSDNPKATEIFNDVRQGFLKNISIGYTVDRYQEVANSDTVRVTGWTLLEASVVTVPADASVGVNRSLPGAVTMSD